MVRGVADLIWPIQFPDLDIIGNGHDSPKFIASQFAARMDFMSWSPCRSRHG